MDAVLRILVWIGTLLVIATVISLIAGVVTVGVQGIPAFTTAIAQGGVDANHGVVYWLYALDYAGYEHPRGDMKTEWAASPRTVIWSLVRAFLALWLGLLAFRIYSYVTNR